MPSSPEAPLGLRGDLFPDVGRKQRVIQLPLRRLGGAVDDARALQPSQRAADGLRLQPVIHRAFAGEIGDDAYRDLTDTV